MDDLRIIEEVMLEQDVKHDWKGKEALAALARVSSRLARLEAVAEAALILKNEGYAEPLHNALAALDAGEEGTLTEPEKLADRGVGSNSGSLSVPSGGEGTT